MTPQFDSKIFTQEMSKHASTETFPGQGTPPPPAVIVGGWWLTAVPSHENGPQLIGITSFNKLYLHPQKGSTQLMTNPKARRAAPLASNVIQDLTWDLILTLLPPSFLGFSWEHSWNKLPPPESVSPLLLETLTCHKGWQLSDFLCKNVYSSFICINQKKRRVPWTSIYRGRNKQIIELSFLQLNCNAITFSL